MPNEEREDRMVSWDKTTDAHNRLTTYYLKVQN